MNYAELAVTTNFSFLRGASHPKEFVRQAAALGYPAIGIADRNTLAGVVRAYEAWEKLDAASRPRLLIGARLVFRDGTPDILAYPKDRKAYGWLSRLLSVGKLRGKKGECLLDFADLLKFRRGLLLVLMPPPDPRTAVPVLRALGSGVWLAASLLYTGEDRRRLRDLKRVARRTRVPLIAVNDALYHEKGRRELQDVVTCIREHVTLAEAGTRLEANAERYLKTPEEMARLFRDCPEAVGESLRFAGRIAFELSELGQRYPNEPVPRGKTADLVTGPVANQRKMTLAVAVTSGDIRHIFVGQTGVFADAAKVEWDAKVIDLVQQPVSLGEAIRSPFYRFGEFTSKQANRFFSAKSEAMEKSLAGSIAAPKPQQAPAFSGAMLLMGGGVGIADHVYRELMRLQEGGAHGTS